MPYSKVYGPEAALKLLANAAGDALLQNYYGFFAIKAYLLEQADRPAEAVALYEQAASLTDNQAERQHLQQKAVYAAEALG